ncbi:MAG: hypothetical protein M3063_05270 [Actinomycetota bacterium]|nr:hypothetical protein [Actinomycetota bacterium]
MNSPSHQAPIGAGEPSRTASMLSLQRMAGNRAVSGLLAGQPAPLLSVQRLSVRPADLAPQIGRSKPGLFGRSTFASIQVALSDYDKARPKDKARLLQRIDTLCTKWFNEHAKSTSPQDLGRRALVLRLLDELPAAQAELSKSQAQDVYMSNVEHAGNKSGKKPGTKFALDALGDGGKMAAQSGASKEGNELAQQKGLTGPEIAAIRIFSASDYSYINPATANSPSWMQAQKSKKSLGLSDKQDRTLMEEGSLHAGVAMQGLSKLDPWDKDAYRGARYTEAEFAEQFLAGKPMAFHSFASSAQDEQVALRFAHGVGIE